MISSRLPLKLVCVVVPQNIQVILFPLYGFDQARPSILQAELNRRITEPIQEKLDQSQAH